jgi:hypothetical protein
LQNAERAEKTTACGKNFWKDFEPNRLKANKRFATAVRKRSFGEDAFSLNGFFR